MIQNHRYDVIDNKIDGATRCLCWAAKGDVVMTLFALRLSQGNYFFSNFNLRAEKEESHHLNTAIYLSSQH